ncbi:MAG: cobalt-precorrin-6A reductase [Pseudomonadota bacterium]
MNVLVLGGTQEAQVIARELVERGYHVIYSMAGLGIKPQLGCVVRSGGFGGHEGLSDHLAVNNIDCLVDATHPYAEKISRSAIIAAHDLSIPLYRYTRPAWEPQEGDDWKTVRNNWPAITLATLPYKRPFFTIGRQPLFHMDDVPVRQEWLIRTLAASDTGNNRVRVLRSRGPFVRQSEVSLMRLTGVDVLVSKNSGGDMVAAKIEAARELNIPVMMVQRPKLAPTKNDFSTPQAMLDAMPRPKSVNVEVKSQAI